MTIEKMPIDMTISKSVNPADDESRPGGQAGLGLVILPYRFARYRDRQNNFIKAARLAFAESKRGGRFIICIMRIMSLSLPIIEHVLDLDSPGNTGFRPLDN